MDYPVTRGANRSITIQVPEACQMDGEEVVKKKKFHHLSHLLSAVSQLTIKFRTRTSNFCHLHSFDERLLHLVTALPNKFNDRKLSIELTDQVIRVNFEHIQPQFNVKRFLTELDEVNNGMLNFNHFSLLGQEDMETSISQDDLKLLLSRCLTLTILNFSISEENASISSAEYPQLTHLQVDHKLFDRNPLHRIANISNLKQVDLLTNYYQFYPMMRNFYRQNVQDFNVVKNCVDEFSSINEMFTEYLGDDFLNQCKHVSITQNLVDLKLLDLRGKPLWADDIDIVSLGATYGCSETEIKNRFRCQRVTVPKPKYILSTGIGLPDFTDFSVLDIDASKRHDWFEAQFLDLKTGTILTMRTSNLVGTRNLELIHAYFNQFK